MPFGHLIPNTVVTFVLANTKHIIKKCKLHEAATPWPFRWTMNWISGWWQCKDAHRHWHINHTLSALVYNDNFLWPNWIWESGKLWQGTANILATWFSGERTHLTWERGGCGTENGVACTIVQPAMQDVYIRLWFHNIVPMWNIRCSTPRYYAIFQIFVESD